MESKKRANTRMSSFTMSPMVADKSPGGPTTVPSRGRNKEGEAVRASPLQLDRGTAFAYGETTFAPALSPLVGVAVTLNVPQVAPGHAP